MLTRRSVWRQLASSAVAARAGLALSAAGAITCAAPAWSAPRTGRFLDSLCVGVNYADKSFSCAELVSPHNDAKLVHGALKKLKSNRNPVLLLEPDHARFDTALSQLTSRPGRGSVALLYFSGHGLLANGRASIVLPYRAAGGAPGALIVDVEAIAAQLRRSFGAVIVIIDACRATASTCPAPQTAAPQTAAPAATGVKGWSRPGEARSSSISLEELVQLEQPAAVAAPTLSGSNYMLVFSTGPEQLANDVSRNGAATGPFSESLAYRIEAELPLDEVLGYVTGDVQRATVASTGRPQTDQTVWWHQSVAEPFFLNGYAMVGPPQRAERTFTPF